MGRVPHVLPSTNPKQWAANRNPNDPPTPFSTRPQCSLPQHLYANPLHLLPLPHSFPRNSLLISSLPYLHMSPSPFSFLFPSHSSCRNSSLIPRLRFPTIFFFSLPFFRLLLFPTILFCSFLPLYSLFLQTFFSSRSSPS